MEKATKGMAQAVTCVRRVWLDGQRCRPHQTSVTGRCILRPQQPTVIVHVVPQQEVCQGEGWYDDATWTWGDYWDDLTYITYETLGGRAC